MRISLHPHCDAFVETITSALDAAAEATSAHLLTVETDDVSTYVGGCEQGLAAYAVNLTAAAHRHAGAHVVTHALFSRGCPGETTCELGPDGRPVDGLAQVPAVDLPASGIRAAAMWSLYPLLDARSGMGDHLPLIEEAISAATRPGVEVATRHYATRLAGDLSSVIAVATDAWSAVGSRVPHVVNHLTISVGSPTLAAREAQS